MKKTVLAISGSYRPQGNTDILIDAIIGEMDSRLQVERIMLRDLSFHSCVGCEACQCTTRCARFEDDMTPLYERIDNARGIILGSPTYNYNITACMKAFIDRLYPYYEFGDTVPRPFKGLWKGTGKVGIVCTVCEQSTPHDMGFVIEAMRWPLEALGCDISTTVSAMLAFRKGDVLKDTRALGAAKEAGRELSSRLI